jgi:Ala-tRNA(Pro) deacylase
METLFSFLDSNGVVTEKVNHPAVFTVEEAKREVPPLPGVETKSLFLRDGSGKRHLLVVVGFDTSVDLKALSEALPSSKLSLASPRRLMEHLGVIPGAVSILALYHDRERHAVEVIVDKEVWEADTVQAHPMVNTATLSMSKADLERFLEATGHEPRAMEVPRR